MLKLNFLILFFLLNLHSHAFDSSIEDVYIESENLDIDIATKKAEFFDNVIVKQGDIKISTDKLVIFFENNEVKKIDFLKNVKFQMRDKLILGDKAEYTKNDNTLKIIDNVIHKGDNGEINGDIFTYNLKTKVSKLSSKMKFDDKTKGRIKAKFKIN
jgi:lipopolysaccharide transport protein LptA